MSKLTICTSVFLIVSMIVLPFIVEDVVEYFLSICAVMAFYIIIIAIKDKDWGQQKNLSILISYLTVIMNGLLILFSGEDDIIGGDLFIIGSFFVLFYMSLIWAIVCFIKRS